MAVFVTCLPHLGVRSIRPDPKNARHFLWLSLFGWHDCSPREDVFIAEQVKNEAVCVVRSADPSE